MVQEGEDGAEKVGAERLHRSAAAAAAAAAGGPPLAAAAARLHAFHRARAGARRRLGRGRNS